MGEFIQFIDMWFRDQNRSSLTGSLIGACAIWVVWVTLIYTSPQSFYTWFVLSICGASVLFFIVIAVRSLFAKPPSPGRPVNDDAPS